jgi:hypothetical protein
VDDLSKEVELKSAFYKELFFTGLGVPDLKDKDGRPFGEANAGEEARVGVPFRWGKSRYPGCRMDKSMNLTGLEQMMRDWPGIMQDVNWLRTAYCRTREITQLTRTSLWFLAWSLTSLPTYIIRRGTPSTEIPGRIAGLYKASIGLHMTIERLLFREFERLESPIGVEEFLEKTEAIEAYLQSDRACAGSPTRIREFSTVVLQGSPEGAVTEDPWLEAWVGNVETYMDYSDLNAWLFVVKNLNMLAGAVLRAELSRLGERSPKAAEMAAQLEDSGRQVPPWAAPSPDLVEGLLMVTLGYLERPVAEISGPERQAVSQAMREVMEDPAVADAAASAVADFMRVERTCIDLAERLQAKINGLLGEESPPPPLESNDLWRLEERLMVTVDPLFLLGRAVGLKFHLTTSELHIDRIP